MPRFNINDISNNFVVGLSYRPDAHGMVRNFFSVQELKNYMDKIIGNPIKNHVLLNTKNGVSFAFHHRRDGNICMYAADLYTLRQNIIDIIDGESVDYKMVRGADDLPTKPYQVAFHRSEFKIAPKNTKSTKYPRSDKYWYNVFHGIRDGRNNKNQNIIAMDGGSGVGKGTQSALVAQFYGLAKLDTGSLYRAVTLYLMRTGFDMNNIDFARAARAVQKISNSGEILSYANNPEIRGADVNHFVPMVSPNTDIRKILFRYQRDFGTNPPALPGGASARGAIVEGRDIGTNIFPDAPVKIYLHADNAEKARRRVKQNAEMGLPADFDEILHSLNERDRLDSERDAESGKLTVAPDAEFIDTTHMTKDEVFTYIQRLINKKLGPNFGR